MGTPVAQLIRILSASIAPVIVISGIGLLLLSMTNRYSRVIERARELIKDLDATGEEPRRKLLVEQIQIIYRRARILRLAIILSAVSILFVAVTVLSLFTGQVIGAQVDYLSVPCFGVSLLRLARFALLLYTGCNDFTQWRWNWRSHPTRQTPEAKMAPSRALN